MFPVMQQMRYWFNPKPTGGPRKGFVVMLDGKLVPVDYSSYDAYRVASQVDQDKAAGVIHGAAKKAGVSGVWMNDVTGYLRYENAGKEENPKSLAKRMLEAKAKEEREELELRADPVRYLESILKDRDWYSHFSDDHGVWAAGMAEDRLIGELKEKMAPEVFKALMDKYMPKPEEAKA